MSNPKKSPFYDIHLKNKAKIVEFANYLMPIQFRGMMEEHRKVRSSVGLFDITHMGEFEVWGKDAESFVQRMTTNDVSKLDTYQVQYSCMCYDHGGIVDDLLVYKLPDHFLLVVNGACLEKDFQWLSDHLSGDAQVKNVSEQTALLALQGPKAELVLKRLTDRNLSDLRFYWARWGKVNGTEMLFSRTGYTGEDGFELYFSPDHAEGMWNALMEAGKEFDIEPIGLGARDSLRLEMKYMLYGNDIDQTTIPLEAGLGWIVKPNKGDFVGKEPILRLKQEGLKRKLVAFELQDQAFPRPHYEIQKGGEKIGQVTSGTFSPSLNKGIGLGYVPIEHSKADTEFDILIRGKAHRALVVKPPFYKDFTHK
ncbi:MAG: glycine cleavage system aminomethyltransferase GcvT [Candidatus Zixiibacteriota bacterium]|nr:MAG: glycine cleavage system aminomethyltransferase GcvT [candidate division Zixibacteria bacterium]